jgi:hypothetical protein
VVVPTTGRRLAAAVVAIAAVAIGAWCFVVLVDRRSQPAYAMPTAVLVIAGIALAAVVVGAVVGTREARAGLTILSVLATLSIAFGFLAIFSIGLPILALGVALAAVLARRLSGGAPRSLLLSGPVLAIGLTGLLVLSAQMPVVSCERGGVSTGTPLWLAGGGSSGSAGGSSESSVRSGTVTLDGETFAFVCDGDRLVRFRH